MPLLSGSSKGVVGENIRTLMKEGRKQSQAVAIAMKQAGLSKPGAKKKKPRYQAETTLEQAGKEVRGKGQNRIDEGDE